MRGRVGRDRNGRCSIQQRWRNDIDRRGSKQTGSILIGTLTSAFITNIQQSSAIPSRVKSEAQVELAGGVPFVSDADLEKALDEANVNQRTSDAAVDAYRDARIDGLTSSLAILALLALVALFPAGRIPSTQPGSALPT